MIALQLLSLIPGARAHDVEDRPKKAQITLGVLTMAAGAGLVVGATVPRRQGVPTCRDCGDDTRILGYTGLGVTATGALLALSGFKQRSPDLPLLQPEVAPQPTEPAPKVPDLISEKIARNRKTGSRLLMWGALPTAIGLGLLGGAASTDGIDRGILILLGTPPAVGGALVMAGGVTYLTVKPNQGRTVSLQPHIGRTPGLAMSGKF